MNFNNRRFYCFYSITNRKGGMLISAGNNDNTIVSKTSFMQRVNNYAFDIRLKISELIL